MDGYNPEKRTIYEFMGCLWHGCSRCYLHNTMNPVNDTSMKDLLEGTNRRIEWFKKLGFRVEVKWECDFKRELTANPEMKAFIDTLKFDTLLEPHDGFFGGHTNAVCLHKEISEDEKIHYVDFTLLYLGQTNVVKS